jgi:hypothetical protein
MLSVYWPATKVPAPRGMHTTPRGLLALNRSATSPCQKDLPAVGAGNNCQCGLPKARVRVKSYKHLQAEGTGNWCEDTTTSQTPASTQLPGANNCPRDGVQPHAVLEIPACKPSRHRKYTALVRSSTAEAVPAV